MANKRLRRVAQLSEDDCKLLEHHHIVTCKDVINKNVLDLMYINHSYTKSMLLLKTVSKIVAPLSNTALQILSNNTRRFFSTSLSPVDEALHGGLALGTITEIAGPPGCGKTQFCIMMSVMATMPFKYGGCNGTAVYIDTENAFTAKRFLEMASHKADNTCDINSLASNVIIYQESTSKSLQTRLESLEEVIIKEKVNLIILDSIASLARKEYGHHAVLINRNQMLMKQATILKYYADTFNIPVLVSNQITTNVKLGFLEVSSTEAALGNTWAHAVNSRLAVKYVDHEVRQLSVVKSPVAPPATFYYKVAQEGLVIL